MKVYMLIEETSIHGIFSSKEIAYKAYGEMNDMSKTEVEEVFEGNGGYPVLEEITVDDSTFCMDR